MTQHSAATEKSKKPRNTDSNQKQPSILRQPITVWAIAFACVVSFMGIGLVDPILPAISRDLNATPSQTMLLFTSYLFITGIAMFFTGWISSRIGIRRTLLVGLGIIVVFAALAGASGTVNQIIGFRAGWGLGNALFISTALAAIVGAASGGSAQAVILYEAALGIGMAAGPLLGGALGSLSWRGPFFGTAALMLIGFVAILVLFRTPGQTAASDSSNADTKPATAHVSILASVRALGNPALRTLSIAALFYNFALFTLLAYSPYPLESAAAAAGTEFGAHELGLVFGAWGTVLAITSVFLAPVLTKRFGLTRTMYPTLALLTVALVGMALSTGSVAVLSTLIIVSGVFLGILNTALTEVVMEATDLPRNVASSTYSGVRFIGGAIAPVIAGAVALVGVGVPYWIGVASLILAIAALAFGARNLSPSENKPVESAKDEALIITVGND